MGAGYGYLEFANGSVGPCPHNEQKVAVIHAHQPINGFPNA